MKKLTVLFALFISLGMGPPLMADTTTFPNNYNPAAVAITGGSITGAIIPTLWNTWSASQALTIAQETNAVNNVSAAATLTYTSTGLSTGALSAVTVEGAVVVKLYFGAVYYLNGVITTGSNYYCTGAGATGDTATVQWDGTYFRVNAPSTWAASTS